MDRVILHADCNSFYASVETVFRPELARVPMAVCGDPESRHGIVLAKNELAKAAGVQTAEPVGMAQRKCPGLVLVPPHHERYREFSGRINQIYLQYTDQVEPFSVDESWLDVTGSQGLFGDGKAIADELRRRVRRETGVTISVGVSFNKVFAKMGSDYKKPDATTVIRREDAPGILYPLPVEAMLFVGRSAAERLRAAGACTVGDLAAFPRERLVALLGKLGGTLSDYARGLDEAPVKRWGEADEVKSVGNSVTYPRDLCGEEELTRALSALADQVAARLRRAEVKCTAVQLTIKSPSLRVITRQKGVAPTYLRSAIRDAAVELLRANWNLSAPVRLLGITGLSLVRAADAPGTQLSLFEPGRARAAEKEEKLARAVDALRQKYGPVL